MTVTEQLEAAPPALDGEDICHIVHLPNDLRTYCGEPCNCNPVGSIGITLPPWQPGDTTCPDCHRPLCPECMQRCRHAQGGPP